MALRSAKQHVPEVRVIPCAHELCQHSAICKVKLEQGWANLCRKHYDYHALRKAKEFCIENGLETADQMRAYCREKSKLFGQAGKNAFQKVMDKAA